MGVVDNWGNFCDGKKGKGTTPGCTVSVDKLEVTLSSSPVPPAPVPSPMPSPTPTPGPWEVCTAGDAACCNPYTEIQQICPSGIPCEECGGGDACRCPPAELIV